MVTIEQVDLLDSKVSKLVEYVERLKSENARFCEERRNFDAALSAQKDECAKLEARVEELQSVVAELQSNHERIEQGITTALERLNTFEDAVYTEGAPEEGVCSGGSESSTPHTDAPPEIEEAGHPSAPYTETSGTGYGLGLSDELLAPSDASFERSEASLEFGDDSDGGEAGLLNKSDAIARFDAAGGGEREAQPDIF